MPNDTSFKNREERIAYYKKYREKNRKKIRLYNREYNRQWRKEHGFHNEVNSKKRYPEKVKAGILLRYAVRMGYVKRQPCAKCGNNKAQAHHPDYKKPLDVVWLCPLHHKEVHLKMCG